MKQFSPSFDDEWNVLGGTERSQAAEMVLAPGGVEGGPDNRHEGSDQWLYVVWGSGRAVVEGRKVELHPGGLLLIEQARLTRSATPAVSRSERSIFTRRRSTDEG